VGQGAQSVPTGYGIGGPGIELIFPGVKSGQGVTLNRNHSVMVGKKTVEQQFTAGTRKTAIGILDNQVLSSM
jgi:hypothetical protein